MNKFNIPKLFTDTYEMPKVSKFLFVVMQKDEGYLLLHWAFYYIRLFGTASILIYDNGSTESTTLYALKFLREIGVKIVFLFNEFRDFQKKGNIYINTASTFTEYKYLIPLDIDEFLYTYDSINLKFDSFSIINTLNNECSKLDNKNNVLRIDKGYTNILYTHNIYKNIIKCIIVNESYRGNLDYGLHLYDFRNNKDNTDIPPIKSKNLGYIHFHYKPYKIMLKTAKQKLGGKVDKKI